MDEKQATPHGVLIEELLDSTVPKTEREHAGALEIKVLQEANDRKNEQIMAFSRQWADLDTQIAALKAENERLRETNEALKRVTKGWRKDAERYRWLRNFMNLAIVNKALVKHDTLDAAIDEAMQEGK